MNERDALIALVLELRLFADYWTKRVEWVIERMDTGRADE